MQRPSNPILYPDAYRLITWRGEGLAKMIRSNFFLDATRLPDTEKWDRIFVQTLDPSHHRPLREIEKEGNIKYAMDPRTKQPIDPSLIRENYDTNIKHEWTVVTSVTALPKDGNIELFGGHGIGILLDVRFVFVDKRFIFRKEAMTSNDWWLRDDARSKQLQAEFKSMSFNELRDVEKLGERVDQIREYSEQLCGLNANSVVGIILHPDPNSRYEDETYYAERFAAIERRIYVSISLGKTVPIIMVGPGVKDYDHRTEESERAKKGHVAHYTIEMQNRDIVEYLSKHKDSPKVKLLKELLNFNYQHPKEEEVFIGRNEKASAAGDLSRIRELELLVAKKRQNLIERNNLMRKLNALSYEMDLYYQIHDEKTLPTPEKDVNEILKDINNHTVLCNIVIDSIDEELLKRRDKDSAGALYAYEQCKWDEREYKLIQDMEIPNINDISIKLSSGKATLDDMRKLNLIDLEHLEPEMAKNAIAKMKMQFFKQQILAGECPGSIVIQVKNKNMNISPAADKILRQIEKAEQSLSHLYNWSRCLELIQGYAVSALDSQKSWLSFTSSEHPNALAFYSMVNEISRLPAKIILERASITSNLPVKRF